MIIFMHYLSVIGTMMETSVCYGVTAVKDKAVYKRIMMIMMMV